MNEIVLINEKFYETGFCCFYIIECVQKGILGLNLAENVPKL